MLHDIWNAYYAEVLKGSLMPTKVLDSLKLFDGSVVQKNF